MSHNNRFTIVVPGEGGHRPHMATGPTIKRALANWRKTWHWRLSSKGKYRPTRIPVMFTPENLAEYVGEIYGVDHIIVIEYNMTMIVHAPKGCYINEHFNGDDDSENEGWTDPYWMK